MSAKERVIDRYEDEQPIGQVGFYDLESKKAVITGRLMARTVKIADSLGNVRLDSEWYPEGGVQ